MTLHFGFEVCMRLALEAVLLHHNWLRTLGFQGRCHIDMAPRAVPAANPECL